MGTAAAAASVFEADDGSTGCPPPQERDPLSSATTTLVNPRSLIIEEAGVSYIKILDAEAALTASGGFAIVLGRRRRSVRIKRGRFS